MPAALLYDENCNICKTITETLLTWDGGRHRLRPVAIQSDEGRHLLRSVPAERHLTSFHLVREDGSVASGGPALAELFEMLPAGALVAKPLELAPGATNRSYQWIADNRVRLSRLIPGAVKRKASELLARRS